MPVLVDLGLLASPWPVVGLVGAYLYFVLKAGPRLMESRPAYSLRPLVALYNLFLVLTQLWGFIKLNRLVYGQFFMASCRPEFLSSKDIDECNDLAYMYFLSKIVELLDTVFFILRKKNNQASFLHVYHHVNMVLLTWVFLRAVPAGQLFVICYSNIFVHILMYSYYFLSALGPGIQKYLWWKRYITRIQIIQFFVIIGFLATLIVHPSCQGPKEILVLGICNTISFLVLFLFFYAKEYSKQKSKLQ